MSKSYSLNLAPIDGKAMNAGPLLAGATFAQYSDNNVSVLAALATFVSILNGEQEFKAASAPYLRLLATFLAAQTAHVIGYLTEQYGLAPVAEAGRICAHQLQLTILDRVAKFSRRNVPAVRAIRLMTGISVMQNDMVCALTGPSAGFIASVPRALRQVAALLVLPTSAVVKPVPLSPVAQGAYFAPSKGLAGFSSYCKMLVERMHETLERTALTARSFMPSHCGQQGLFGRCDGVDA